MLTMQQLRESLPRPGRVEWAGLRSQRRGEVLSVPEVLAHPLVGLVGDHGKLVPTRLKAINGPAGESLAVRPTPEPTGASAASYGGKRQVTLIQAEHLPVIAALAGLERVTPDLLRRNIVISGLPLLALKDRRFRMGSDERGWVLLEGTGECHPCSRMEETLGPGGYNAVRGHGGITARVLEGGHIRLGDLLIPL
ncbi:MOSC domain-containing protein [Deinococcus sp. KNUC1210]|uniref:MOSC domain-containing protein n=1 Tax=Deinococcus sp. KNUC1210 TaxID=2917691 RepID=UPI001EEF9481|nr:MOSC domain-containing protein [Deinococcus sp. KNUC1210]ULH14709.1 MOSC domain-containing protein [Deinococcus sp. KNUC1210]